MLTLEPGTVIHNRYRILRPIGKGGMGAVYEAIDRRLHNSVALKLMTARGADAGRAFEQEAQLLASLRHSGLPAVIDYFVEEDRRLLVMQYIDGEDLESFRKRQGGRCEQHDVLSWGVDVLNVLSFLHGYEPPVIHRDIKPANLKLTPAGAIVLLDFGLAKGGRESTTHVATGERSIYGFTPSYAPPEQRQGRVTDARSDLYALGATLYHLATGVAPIAADARAAAVTSGAPDPLPPAHQVDAAVSRGLSAILSRALQLDADARFQTADEMRLALADLRNIDREPPRGMECRGSRRIDAAMPSQAEVGRQVDLIVQVRFAASPRLGVEDWPSKRVPDKIEQASEAVDIQYPIDARTHRQLPARLRVKLVAPDFTIDGTAECLIEVPPNAYSKRLAFLLTPRHVGLCRVHVEVYATDMLHLGTVPIEADAVVVPVANAAWRIAHLVMGMFTGEASPRAPVLFEQPRDQAARTPIDAHAGAIHVSDGSASGTEFPLPRPEVRLREPADSPQTSLDEAAPLTPAMPGSRKGLPRWMVVGTPLVVLLAAVIVMQRAGRLSPDPSPMAPPPAATPPVAEPAPPAAGSRVPSTLPTPQQTELAPRAAANAPGVSKLPPINVRPSDPRAVIARPGENAQDYSRRNRAAQQDYEFGKQRLTEGDLVAAVKTFESLAKSEPGWLDVSTYLKNSQEALAQARREALSDGLRLEKTGVDALNYRRLAEAATALIAASKAFDRAASLQAPTVEKLRAENLARRLQLAKAVLQSARTHANNRNRGEAAKLFQVVIDLLPPGDALRLEAESDLKRLGPGAE